MRMLSIALLPCQAKLESISPMLDSLADRLSFAFAYSGIRKADVARACNVTPQAVSGWTRTGRISKELIFVIADLTGFRAEWIATGEGAMFPDGTSVSSISEIRDPRQRDRVRLNSNLMRKIPPSLSEAARGENHRRAGRVPVISYVTAGSWCEAVDNFQPGNADEWLPCPTSHGPHTFALEIDGDSMTSPYPNEKSYPHGTVCFFDPDKQAVNGSKVVAKIPGKNEVTFKKLVIDAGRTYLMPLNPKYDPIQVTEELHICGVLIGSFIRE